MPIARRSRFLLASLAATALAAPPPAFAQPVPAQAVPTDPALAGAAVPAANEPKLPAAQLVALLRQKVKYVFVIYQENRSFDSYFGTFPGADGLYSKPAAQMPGFDQTIINIDGSTATIHPFRIGPAQYAADTDDIDHSHALTVAKMDVQHGVPQMDRFAVTEEKKYSPHGNPSLMAKQFGELAMAHEDCDTVPFLWRYANRFTLFDHIFELMTGPSTPGNLSIIAAQTGQTQWALHPDEAWRGTGNSGPGEPVENDSDPLWGSPKDRGPYKLPVNPADFKGKHPYGVQLNQTYASLPLTMGGAKLGTTVKQDSNPKGDLADVSHDVPAITRLDRTPVNWGWYEEGYDHEPTDPSSDPVDATGVHASYIAHHNGPQYFGYIANNPAMAAHLHGLGDFFADVKGSKLPAVGGLFYIKGGYQNIFGLKPANPDPRVQKNFRGDDDHPAYSDAQISEAMAAKAINAIAASPYWTQSAIIITWDDSEGDYDHVRPPVVSRGPDGSVISAGPRVPLLLISPYARAHAIVHAAGTHGSVVKFADAVFNLPPLATLPDELQGRKQGDLHFHQSGLGPDDALTPDVTDLLGAFDPARLSGKVALLPGAYAMIPDAVVNTLPQQSGFGCKQIGIVPVDVAQKIPNVIPADFNPRPHTMPTVAK